jgi:hypothetical protein
MDHLSQLKLEQRIREHAEQSREAKKVAMSEVAEMADEFGSRYVDALKRFNDGYRQLNEPDHMYHFNVDSQADIERKR